MSELEKLKAKADKLGYKLVKKPSVMPKLTPCICGRKRIDWYKCVVGNGYAGFVYKCPKCKLKAEPAKTYRQARENWNKAAEAAKEDYIL